MTFRGGLFIFVLSVLSALGACQSSAALVADGGAGAPAGGTAGARANGYAGTRASGGTAGASAMPGYGLAGAGGEPGSNAPAGAGNEAGSASAGSAGSSAEGGSREPAREVAYVATALHGLSACTVGASGGEPKLLAGSPIDPQSTITAIAVNGAQRMLYAVDDGRHIASYRMADDGNLPPSATASLALPNDVNTLALDPQGRFAYAGSSQGRALDVLAIDPSDGTLSALGNPVPVGGDAEHGGAAFVCADPGGHFVYVSQTFELGIRAYRVDESTGSLSELPGSPFAAIGTPDDQAVFGGALVIAPRGNFMYASGGALHGFALDSTTGKLSALPGSPFSLDVQSDPDAANLAIDPQGTYLYAAHFLGSNHISGFAIDQTTGALAQAPGSPVVGASPYALAVDPSGRFLYVGNDGPNGVSVFGIARATGALTQHSESPFTIGGLEPAIVFGLTQ